MKNRDLILFFTIRELSLRYKQSYLGIFWIFLQPFLYGLPFIIFFSFLAKSNNPTYSYPLYVYIGFFFWNFVTNAVGTGVYSISNHSTIVGSVSFPKYVLPLSIVFARIIDFLISLPILLILLLFFHVPLSFTQLLIFPIFITEVILVMGLIYLLSSLHVFYRDIGNITPFFLFLWLFSTPVVYSIDSLPQNLLTFIQFNPMVGIINTGRDVLLSSSAVDWKLFIISALVSSFIFIIGTLIFRYLEPQFPDVI